MAKKLNNASVELGVAGQHTRNGSFRADEFLRDLKGHKAIKTYREMRDNSAIIGAVLYATEQVLRDVKLKVIPSNESDEAKKEAEFVESVLDDMEHTLDDHIAEALSSLTFGFSWFETVYKRRVGPYKKDPKKRSKYTDGRIGIRKLASRAPWTIQQFDVDDKTGEVLGIKQNTGINTNIVIPTKKSLYYRTTTVNDDPSGRSILRNAYTSYVYLNNLQSIEAIAIEREMHGIPVGRLPAEYLSPDATEDQQALRESFEAILRDIKLNEQGYALLPSDLWVDSDGDPTGGVGTRLVDIELITSNGSRNVDIDPIIRRYQHDIARSVLSEFLVLGSGQTGSYALSKSKTDLFLRALESYINSIVDVLNKQLVERLWELNGLDIELMPKIKAGDVAPHDLKEISGFLRNLNGANIDVSSHKETVESLMEIAELDYKPDDEEFGVKRQNIVNPAKPDSDVEEDDE